MHDTYKEIILILTAGSVLFLVLAGIVVFVLLFYQKRRFQHREQMVVLKNSMEQELLKAQLEAQEAAFRQIAEELHDNVGQLLSSTKILLAITQRSLAQPPGTLQTAEETLAKAIKDLRSLSKSLNKEWLEKFNLVDNLRTEADRINAARMVRVEVEATIDILPLKPEEQVMLFRIIQEALQNCIKHSEAGSISIRIEVVDKIILVGVRDDGKGLPEEIARSGSEEIARSGGLGLLNMEHRTHLLGGTICWQSTANQGTTVSIQLPVQIPVICD